MGDCGHDVLCTRLVHDRAAKRAGCCGDEPPKMTAGGVGCLGGGRGGFGGEGGVSLKYMCPYIVHTLHISTRHRRQGSKAESAKLIWV